MQTCLTWLSMLLAVALAIPLLTLAMECFCALLPLRRWPRHNGTRPRCAVLVPAHNEEAGIEATVRAVAQQLAPGDRLIVIADNCTDGTAARAASAGAAVWERQDAERRGKGYALHFAFERLAADPPDVVICIDADCQPEEECLSTLARTAVVARRPIQAAYLMHAPEAGGVASVSAFAVLIRNYVRMRGLQRLGLPCLLTGSGMAFPWQVLRAIPAPAGHIVEDMRLATDAVLAGFPPRPCVEAVIHSSLPSSDAAFVSQRTRWEHGHLSIMASEIPRLLRQFLRRPLSLDPLLLAANLSVPPLMLLALLATVAMLVSMLLATRTGYWRPMLTLLSSCAALISSLALCWWRFGRDALPPRDLVATPLYAMRKIPIYLKFLTGRQTVWVRTQRRSEKSRPGCE